MENKNEKQGDGLVNGGLEAINHYNPTDEQKRKDENASMLRNDGALKKVKSKRTRILGSLIGFGLLCAGGCGYYLNRTNQAENEKTIIAGSMDSLKKDYSSKLQTEAQKSKILAEQAAKAKRESQEKQEKINNLEKMLRGQKDTLSVVDMSFCKSDVSYNVEYRLGKDSKEHYVVMQSKKGGEITPYNVTLCGAGILFNKSVLSTILGEEKSKEILHNFSAGELNLKLEKYVIIEKDSNGKFKSHKEITPEQKKKSFDYFKKYE